MKRPGLPPAERRALIAIRSGRSCNVSDEMIAKLLTAELVDENTMRADAIKLTPRGHAALAAPRMTRREYDCLRCYAGEDVSDDHGLNAFNSCIKKGWVTRDPGSWPNDIITPAGRTALNNMRAAEGSADYKEST